MPMHVETITSLSYCPSESRLAIADAGNVVSLSDTQSGECLMYETFESAVTSIRVAQIESVDCILFYTFRYNLVSILLEFILLIGTSNSFTGYSLKGDSLWKFDLNTSVVDMFMLDIAGNQLHLPAVVTNSCIKASEVVHENISGPVTFEGPQEKTDDNLEPKNAESLSSDATVNSVHVVDKVDLVISTTKEKFEIEELGYIGPRYLLVCGTRDLLVFDSESTSIAASGSAESNENIRKSFQYKTFLVI